MNRLISIQLGGFTLLTGSVFAIYRDQDEKYKMKNTMQWASRYKNRKVQHMFTSLCGKANIPEHKKEFCSRYAHAYKKQIECSPLSLEEEKVLKEGYWFYEIDDIFNSLVRNIQAGNISIKSLHTANMIDAHTVLVWKTTSKALNNEIHTQWVETFPEFYKNNSQWIQDNIRDCNLRSKDMDAIARGLLKENKN